eukprot:Nitzschia sp. Nitz4//scaffold98_size77359//27179//28055//NITZ4_005545-RA/size77359-augustus-gene-0.46-mRNA-1//1//CDS//3329560748//101//frame0
MSMFPGSIRDLVDEMEHDDETPEISQPIITPQGGAESLFLGGLDTSDLRADVLAQHLRFADDVKVNASHRVSSVASLRSTMTDDFHSCREDVSPTGSFTEDLDDEATTFTARSSLKPELEETMSAVAAPVPVTTDSTPMKTMEPSSDKGIDVAETVYSKAKDVWSWGKGVPLVSIGLGITEAVVGKAVSLVGTDLEDIDSKIKPQLEKIDHGVLNPAIDKVVGVVLGAAGKTEEIVKPIVVKILSPFGLIKNEAENPELTLTK